MHTKTVAAAAASEAATDRIVRSRLRAALKTQHNSATLCAALEMSHSVWQQTDRRCRIAGFLHYRCAITISMYI